MKPILHISVGNKCPLSQLEKLNNALKHKFGDNYRIIFTVDCMNIVADNNSTVVKLNVTDANSFKDIITILEDIADEHNSYSIIHIFEGGVMYGKESCSR